MNNKLSKVIKGFVVMLTICSIVSISIPTLAAEIDKQVKVDYNLDNICKTNTSNYVSIKDKKYPLYRVFNDQNRALENINSVIPNLLNGMALKYNLNPLTNDNWIIYQEKLYDYVNYLSEGESDPEFILLRKFFDIYENSEKNVLIMNYVNNNNLADNTFAISSNDEELAILLPYTNPISQEYNNTKVSNSTNNITASSSFNISAGISYATSYANNPNTYNYMYFPGGDCTNFASQILEAGGVSQIYTGSANTGWWHTCIISGGMSSNHKNSNSWSVADTFCKYWGISLTALNITSFSYAVSSGKFIAADFETDGDWNHVGFITAKNSTITTIGGQSYYDFKVAQHTTDYHEWVSSSYNGWDNIGTSGGTYAIINR